ncbi:MAG: hypothetical protein RIQ81_158 [Pseudomonadota bacterium]|jgi:hypothetical protein
MPVKSPLPEIDLDDLNIFIHAFARCLFAWI